MPRDKQLPTLADLIDHKIDIAMASMNKISLGTIQAFDSEDQTATVSVNYKRIIKEAKMASNNIDTSDEIMEYPILVKCPVVVLSGGSARLTLPIAKDDTCLLLFCDREIDTWFRTGVVTFPQSERIHSLTDAVALVGIRSTQNAITDFNSILASLVDRTGERLAQAGMVSDFAGETAPSGWLLCYGQNVSRETYADLFAAIGTKWGAGDGTTTFAIPDFRGCGSRGLDNMGGTNADRLTNDNTPNRNTLGALVGEETHLLTGDESGIQEHDHDVLRRLSDGGAIGPVQAGYVASGGNNTVQTNAKTTKTGDTDAVIRHNNIPIDRMINKIIKY